MQKLIKKENDNISLNLDTLNNSISGTLDPTNIPMLKKLMIGAADTLKKRGFEVSEDAISKQMLNLKTECYLGGLTNVMKDISLYATTVSTEIDSKLSKINKRKELKGKNVLT